MADAVESSALAGDTPGRRVRQRSAWRLLLEHVRPYRWTILGGGLLGFLGGLASLAQPMAVKLADDTLGQHQSLAGPVALLAGSDHRRGPAQHGPPGIRRCGTAGRPHEAIGAVSSQAATRHPPGSASPGNTVDR